MNNTPRPKFIEALRKKNPKKWLDKLKSNPLSFMSAIWLAGLSIGGMFFLLYFLSINYFPEIDLSSATSFLIAMAITGTGLSILLAFYLIFPALFWREIVNDKNNKPSQSETFLLFILLPASTCFWAEFRMIWPITIAAILLIISYLLINRDKTDGWLCIYIVLNVFVFFVPVLLAFDFNSDIHDEEFIYLFTITLITIFIINYFIAVVPLKESRWQFYIVIAVLFLLFITVVTHKTFLIPQTIVKVFKFGNIDAPLVLDEQGCAIVKSYKSNPVASAASGVLIISTFGASTNKSNTTSEKSASTETCLISNIKILSKIGKEFYLQASGVMEQNTNQISKPTINIFTFSIPSAHVLSWSATTNQKP